MPENGASCLKGGATFVAREVSWKEWKAKDCADDALWPQGLWGEVVLRHKVRTEVMSGGQRVVGVVDVVVKCCGFDHRSASETDGNFGGGVDDNSHLLHFPGLDSLGCPFKGRFVGI